MQLSDDLSLENMSFGKKADKVDPYNQVISWDRELTIERLTIDGSPFYLRKSQTSPQLVIKDLTIKDSILDGFMTWLNLDRLETLRFSYCQNPKLLTKYGLQLQGLKSLAINAKDPNFQTTAGGRLIHDFFLTLKTLPRNVILDEFKLSLDFEVNKSVQIKGWPLSHFLDPRYTRRSKRTLIDL